MWQRPWDAVGGYDMTIWKMAGLTDPGRTRERNEDAIAWQVEQGWAVLADGMGGHQAGDVASAMAVEQISEQLKGCDGCDIQKSLQEAVVQANQAIYRQASQQAHLHTMGTTVVAVGLQDKTLHYAQVGDSRLYRLRDGRLQQITRDHSLVQELVDEGILSAEQARKSEQKNLITRALGLESTVEVTMGMETIQQGDSYLICSDGLSDYLDEAALTTLLANDSLPEVTKTLVAAANEQGGGDNISVIVIRIWE